MKTQSMTYGSLPTREAFELAFERECPDETFEIRRCSRVGDADFDVDGLWAELRSATDEWNDEGNEESGDWASCVLSILGFEWI